MAAVNNEKLLISATVATCGLAAYLTFKYWTASKKNSKTFKKFIKIGHLKSINFMPFKSCVPLEESSAILTELGIMPSNGIKIRDRSFMIYSPKINSLVSAKFLPRLAKMKVVILGDQTLELNFCDGSEKFILKASYDHMIRNVDIFGKCANVFDCGDEAGEWISDWIFKSKSGDDEKVKEDFRIVFFDPENECERDINDEMVVMQEKLGRYFPTEISYKTTLTDLGSYSIHSTQSEEYVSRQLLKENPTCKKLAKNCFRSTFIIDCLNKSKPFQEDHWDEIYIGDKNENFKLKFYAPVPRCQLTVTDRDTGLLRTDGQPLKWLNENRRLTDSQCDAWGIKGANHFANYFGVRLDNENDTCEVKVGDPVYVRNMQ